MHGPNWDANIANLGPKMENCYCSHGDKLNVTSEHVLIGGQRPLLQTSEPVSLIKYTYEGHLESS